MEETQSKPAYAGLWTYQLWAEIVDFEILMKGTYGLRLLTPLIDLSFSYSASFLV
jgi:hypothetical protein